MSIIFATTGKDTTPALLGVEFAIGAITALTLTLIATVRRRRRELALYAWLHRTPTREGSRLAVEHRRGHRGCGGCVARNRSWTIPMEPPCPRDQDRTPSQRSTLYGGIDGSWRTPVPVGILVSELIGEPRDRPLLRSRPRYQRAANVRCSSIVHPLVGRPSR